MDDGKLSKFKSHIVLRVRHITEDGKTSRNLLKLIMKSDMCDILW